MLRHCQYAHRYLAEVQYRFNRRYDLSFILKRLIKAGVDSIEENRAARSLLAASRANAMTFEKCAIAYINVKSPEWVNATHIHQWSTTLVTYAYPIISKLLVQDVKQSHIMLIPEPIGQTKTETAVRLRGRREKILDWSTVSGYRPEEIRNAGKVIWILCWQSPAKEPRPHPLPHCHLSRSAHSCWYLGRSTA